MTSKEVVQKAYDCFATGDMDTFRTLYNTDVVVKINGMHKFSGTYNGFDDWMNKTPEEKFHVFDDIWYYLNLQEKKTNNYLVPKIEGYIGEMVDKTAYDLNIA